MLVVEDPVGNCKIPGFSTLVIDNKVGCSELAADVENGRLNLQQMSVFITTMGRFDVLQRRDLEKGLRWLTEAIHRFGTAGLQVVVTGPVPQAGDNVELTQ